MSCYYCGGQRNGCAECRPKIKEAGEQALKNIEQHANTEHRIPVRRTRLEDLLDEHPMPAPTAQDVIDSCKYLVDKLGVTAAEEDFDVKGDVVSYMTPRGWRYTAGLQSPQSKRINVIKLENGLVRRDFGITRTLGEPSTHLDDWFAALCRNVETLDASIKLELVCEPNQDPRIISRTIFEFDPDPTQRTRVKQWVLENAHNSDDHEIWARRITNWWKWRRAVAIDSRKTKPGARDEKTSRSNLPSPSSEHDGERQ